MRKLLCAVAVLALVACNQRDEGSRNATEANVVNGATPMTAATLSLVRLDCGKIAFKNFDKFFSDKPGLYTTGPKDVTDSCYVIRHGDQVMLWDTGLPAELKGTTFPMGDNGTMSLDKTIEEQLAQLNLKPEDIDIVGISHSHGDHTGQASLFPKARLIIGQQDFKLAQEPSRPGGPNPIAPWAEAKGGPVTLVSNGESDIFGDGSVVAMHLPGHTPDHMALLVRLKSGPVLLTGDLYHSTEAREKRGVPPFNTSREQTLQSMDKFEALAKQLGAKVIIQHEPNDISKLPAFPQAAQ
jgi:glyoxylase-like metal-dependent hydrolase (beta-lactamase superfamily II)